MSILDTVNDAIKGIQSIGGALSTSSANFSSNSSVKTAAGKQQKIPSSINQSERLFTTRSRSINHQDGGGNRGERTYIKLISSDSTTAISRHLSELGQQSSPSSLGTSSSGPLADIVNGKNPFLGYASFLLTGIHGNLTEKLQVTEVFGDAEVAYYFGRQPVTVEFGGTLIDSPDNNWFIQWMEMYANVLRGSQLARSYELLKVVTPNLTFIGTVTGMGWDQDAQRDVDIPFRFSMLVKQVIPNPVIVSGVPLSGGTQVDLSKGIDFKTQSQINTQKSLLSGLQSTIQNPFSTIQDYSNAFTSVGSLGSSFTTSVPLLGSLDSGGGASSTLKSVLAGNGSNDAGSSISGLFNGVTSNLAGLRASLFSPVYGVLSSLTKLISSSASGAASIGSVIGSFTKPLQDIIRDVRNVSNQAVGIVNLVNNTIHAVGVNSQNLDQQLASTLGLLKKTGGVISSAPQTVSSNIRFAVNAGSLPATVAFLQNKPGTIVPNNGVTTTSKILLLNSGPKTTINAGAHI